MTLRNINVTLGKRDIKTDISEAQEVFLPPPVSKVTSLLSSVSQMVSSSLSSRACPLVGQYFSIVNTLLTFLQFLHLLATFNGNNHFSLRILVLFSLFPFNTLVPVSVHYSQQETKLLISEAKASLTRGRPEQALKVLRKVRLCIRPLLVHLSIRYKQC